jgi:cobalt/nickel transport system permease protein
MGPDCLGPTVPPPWLGRPEEYRPRADKDRFIEKSIISLLFALARVRERSRPAPAGSASAVHPAIGLLLSFLAILLVSLSRSLAFLAIVGTAELLLLSALEASRIASVLRTALAAAGFALVVFLPSMLWGNLPGTLAVAGKVLLSVAAASLVTAIGGWRSLTAGLSALRLPESFVLVLDLAIKYVSLLGGIVLDMLYALKLRSVGRNRAKVESLGGIAGTVFLKSKEAAEEMVLAMECRGFSGSYRVGTRRRPRAVDGLAILAGAVLIGAFAYFQAR